MQADRFVSLDLETANSDQTSICQIGVVVFEYGKIKHKGCSLIDPLADFNYYNTKVHGLTKQMCEGKPTFLDVYGSLSKVLNGAIVVHHGSFDKSAMNKTTAKLGLPEFKSQWVDSAILAKNSFPEYKNGGYKLNILSERFGIKLENHHDALEDAIACGEVFLKILEHREQTLQQFIQEHSRRGISRSYSL